MPAQFVADKSLIDKATQVITNQQLTAKTGLIVSGDSFIGTKDQRMKIKQISLKRWLQKWKQLQLLRLAIN